MAGDTTNGNGDDSLKLRELIEELPQELQDIIYDMTFTADSKVHIYGCGRAVREYKLKELDAQYSTRVVEINKGLPHLLWVDRHSRQKFASSYFGHDSFFALYSTHEWVASSVLGSLRDLIPKPLLVFGSELSDEALAFFESAYRRSCVYSMGAAFAKRIVLISHEKMVELIKQRAAIATEDAEVIETPLKGGEKAED